MNKLCWIVMSFVLPTYQPIKCVLCKKSVMISFFWPTDEPYDQSTRNLCLRTIWSLLNQEMMNEKTPQQTEQNIILTFVTEARPLSDKTRQRKIKSGSGTQTQLWQCASIAQQLQNVPILLLGIWIIWMVLFSFQSNWKYLRRWVLKVENECTAIVYEWLIFFSPCLKGLVGACGISVLCNLMRVYYFTQTCR